MRTVTGGISGTTPATTATGCVPTWKPNYITDNEAGPLGALLVNSGSPEFTPPETRAVDPAVHAAAELAGLAVARGVVVGGPPAAGVAPEESGHPGHRPLGAALGAGGASMVRESDNTAAELHPREMGRRVRRGRVHGRRRRRRCVEELARMGLPTDGVRLGDGSGLEATNTVTCGVLAAALRDGPPAPPLAGRRRAVRHPALRLAGTPLEGRLAAKTGTLRGVTGLAGFVDGGGAVASPSWPTAPSPKPRAGCSRTASSPCWPTTPDPNPDKGSWPCGEPRRRRLRSPPVAEGAEWPTIPARGTELVDLVVGLRQAGDARPAQEARQDRRLRRGGRRSASGSGAIFLEPGALRALQTETDTFDANLTWLPYVIAMAVLMLVVRRR